jgi:hypothetical protein
MFMLFSTQEQDTMNTEQILRAIKKRSLDDTKRICLPGLVPVELKERYELLHKLSSYKTWEAVSLHKLKQVWEILNS